MDHYRGYAKKLFLGSRTIFLKLFGQKYAYSQIFVFDFIVPLNPAAKIDISLGTVYQALVRR